MKTALTPIPYLDPQTNKEKVCYRPYVRVLLISSKGHRAGKPIESLIDTGADFNVFPWEYAEAFLGFSDKTLRKGTHLDITGVGDAKKEGYGHRCTIHHPDFRIENANIFFVKNQPCPLLGRVGFMDQFRKIIIDEENKTLELIK